jgi:hypothetical protein
MAHIKMGFPPQLVFLPTQGGTYKYGAASQAKVFSKIPIVES